MTDRVRTLTVLLDRDMRTDDVEMVVNAIKMIRRVADVETGPVVDSEQHFARSIAFRKLKKMLWKQLLSWEEDEKVNLTEE